MLEDKRFLDTSHIFPAPYFYFFVKAKKIKKIRFSFSKTALFKVVAHVVKPLVLFCFCYLCFHGN